MNEVLQFAALGLGSAAVYALLATGVVLVYRGSGIVNFAQGAFALVGGLVFIEMDKTGAPPLVSIVAAMAAGVVLGGVMHNGVLRPLRTSAPITKVIVTLGVLIAITAAAGLRYGEGLISVEQFLPRETWKPGGVVISSDRVILYGIAVAVTLGLGVLQRYWLVGLATRGAAENDVAASTLGWSPNALATINWMMGGALAGLAGALIVPVSGLVVSNMVLLIVPALAAALVGRFNSFVGALVGATAIGVGQTLVQRFWDQPGAPDALPFIFVILLLVATGQTLPLRSHVNERLPTLGSGAIRPLPVLVFAGVTAVLIGGVLNVSWIAAVTVSLAVAVVLLSIVVITGYAGQISLAQFALAGLGAYIAGRLVATQDFPFWAAMLVGVTAAIPIGILFALPALRTRGVNLAVVTLGLGLAVHAMLFNNPAYSGGVSGTAVGQISLFGLEIDALAHPEAWALFVLTCFTLSALLVANLRTSILGRRMIAVRENERAAASLGVSVVRVKLAAFAVASALAALGGILIAFRFETILFNQFTPLQSIYAVAYAVIGGLGYVLGPLVGSTLAVGGVGTLLNGLLSSIDDYLVLIGGVVVILTLILNPDGVVSGTTASVRTLSKGLAGKAGARRRASARLKCRFRSRRPQVVLAPADGPIERRETKHLVVEDLTVRFGGVVAVDGLSFSVAPGEVVGLIGPNGAGKTTAIDAVTGFVKAAAGRVSVNDKDITRKAAAGRTGDGVVRSWQSLELFEDVTILENILIASESQQGSLAGHALSFLLPHRRRLNPVASLAVREFDLEEHLDRLPGEVSYGTRRLAGIARAVALNPSILLLDEPAAGLTSSEGAELAGLIRRLVDKWNIGVVLVEHDVDLVMGLCDKIVVLEYGRKIAEGTPEQIRQDPEVLAAYLGEEHVAADAAASTTSAAGGKT